MAVALVADFLGPGPAERVGTGELLITIERSEEIR